jgi:hypothetical protein
MKKLLVVALVICTVSAQAQKKTVKKRARKSCGCLVLGSAEKPGRFGELCDRDERG